jgi:hypothetical protein
VILGDYQRFECAYHLVIVSSYNTLQESLRAVELDMGQLLTILHRIEWCDDKRLFKIHEGVLRLTAEGEQRVRIWRDAIRALGISV